VLLPDAELELVLASMLASMAADEDTYRLYGVMNRGPASLRSGVVHCAANNFMQAEKSVALSSCAEVKVVHFESGEGCSKKTRPC